MKTKWDVLFKLFEIKEGTLSQISEKVGSSPSSIGRRLKELVELELVFHEGKLYKPNKESKKIFNIFNIMKFCRNKGVNYNLFLSKEFAYIAKEGLSKEEAFLSNFKKLNYKTVRKYLTYLNRINLVFVISKKPLTVKFIHDPVFEDVLSFFDLEMPEKIKIETQGKIQKEDYTGIEQLLKRLTTLKKNIDLSDLEEELKIEFTSASTQLEGNTFTLEESKELILHDIIPENKKLKEANEIKNYYNAVNYTLSHIQEPISFDLVLDLHRIIIYNLGVKEGIRATQVSIKGNPFYKVSHFSEILPKLNVLCEKLNKFIAEKHNAKETIEFATFAHNEFQHIHPFEDGNSRMTRLLWNLVLMKKGFPLINIYSNTKEEYLSLTKLARERSDSKLNSFLLKIIKDNLYKRLRV